ncbi:hypothetical protein L2E82_45748 [Cichorium intybus]|uniref:Uncharacterized protein n=1 Tax=Cichorium intybus TaxID=13427 RepID=A0ACB8ZTT5_CICIN|nr:hypothetical protein L2E82_45748 [Cichorium intybus]
MLITFLILFVGGDSLAIRSAVRSPAVNLIKVIDMVAAVSFTCFLSFNVARSAEKGEKIGAVDAVMAGDGSVTVDGVNLQTVTSMTVDGAVDAVMAGDGCDGDESVGARKVMEETALAQGSPIDPNVFVDGNSYPTVKDAASDPTSPLLSTVMHAKSVNGNSNHGHAQIKGDYFAATRIESIHLYDQGDVTAHAGDKTDSHDKPTLV